MSAISISFVTVGNTDKNDFKKACSFVSVLHLRVCYYSKSKHMLFS